MRSIYRNVNSFGKVLALVAIGGLSLVSCNNKDDNNIFDEDPIVRVDKAKAELKRHLVEESPNGWFMSFRPDGGKYTGEFNVWFDFNEDWSVDIKTDLDRGDLVAEKSDYNFTMLRTFALSFPYGNKIHEFTAMDAANLRTDIEFMFNNYFENGDVETVGFMSNQKVVFKQATAEEKAFVFPAMWQAYDRLQATTIMDITYGGRTHRMQYTPIVSQAKGYEGVFYRMATVAPHNVMGSVSASNSVTFAADRNGEIITLKPELEMPDGSLVKELVWTGSAFIGSSDTGTVTIR